MARVVHWNGKDLPEELRALPARRYAVSSVDETVDLTPDEDQGLRQALISLRAGNDRSVSQVRETIRAVLK